MHKENNKERLHVLYLPRWYPHKYDPMHGLFIERHGIAASAYCNVSVLYVHPDENLKDQKFYIDESWKNKLPAIRIYYKNINTGIIPLDKLINIYRFFSFNQKGIRIIRRKYGKPDVIHVHVLTRHGLIALLSKIFYHIPYVITEHWTRYLPSVNTFKGFFRKVLTRIVIKHASAVMPVTENLKNAMVMHGLRNKNYIVIPNVVNMEMFQPAAPKETRDIKRIIHISCFDNNQKNISGILRVIQKLSEERQDFCCDMIGEGIDFEWLTGYGKELDIKDRFVFFHGLKENEALADMIKQSDFMVMFSNYENLPVVILESYASGIPVISTDVGGIREHLDKNLGILIRPNDEEQLYNGIKKMLDNNKQYEATRIRQYAEEHFSNEVIGKRLFLVYQQAKQA